MLNEYQSLLYCACAAVNVSSVYACRTASGKISRLVHVNREVSTKHVAHY